MPLPPAEITERGADLPPVRGAAPVVDAPRRRRGGPIFVVVAAVALVLDQLTKHWVRGSLDVGEHRTVVPHVLDLRPTENHGIAFSLFDGAGIWVVGITVVVAVVLFVALPWLTRGSRLGEVGAALVAGGAIGNIVDRVRLSYVVDFLRLPHWPVFNVADCCIVVGVVLILLVQLRTPPATDAAGAARG